MRDRLFCFGYGYTCDFLGRMLKSVDPSWELAGTTRDQAKRNALRERGIDAYLFDSERPLGDPLLMMQGVTHLLISTPPDHEGDIVHRLHIDDILRIPTLKWIGYLSTTGVYGDRDGSTVDENTEISPNTIRGTRRAVAESQWVSTARARNLPLRIFRLAGIYGPGRSAIDSVRAGIARRIIKPGHAFSRIHVEDIVQTLIASFAHPAKPAEVYNVVDDEAAPSHEVIAYASRLLGKEPPPLIRFEDANLAPITLSFYSDNKRVKNAKIKADLGVKLAYPNYRLGLEGCLKAEQDAEASGHTPPWALQIKDGTGGQF